MSRPWQFIFGVSLAALIVAGPWGYARYRQQSCHNFRVVHQGKLYRSGQMNLAGLQRTLQEYGIRTVINLRDGSAPEDKAEEAYCLKSGVNFHRLPHLPWWASDGTVPAQENVDRIRAIVGEQKNWPVLIHCFAGHHRTGAMCAVLRIDQDGWTNEQAIREMKALGYATIDGDLDVLDYLTKYRPKAQVYRAVSRQR